MAKRSYLSELMDEPLPTVGKQRRLTYRTNEREVKELYEILNYYIFNNKLKMPEIEVMPRCRKYWGICFGSYTMPNSRRSFCKIRVMDKWFCQQWLITTLAHEMCHQYQWDVEGVKRIAQGREPIMSHGPSFYIFREKLAKHGISLKSAHSQRRWFKHQNLFKA